MYSSLKGEECRRRLYIYSVDVEHYLEPAAHTRRKYNDLTLSSLVLNPPRCHRTRAVEHDLARAKGYHGFFNHCKLPRKVSYSGVATFVRSESGLRTLASTTSLGDAGFFGSPGAFAGRLGLSPDRLATLDSEGRVLVTDHGHFVLFNVYAPCIRCVYVRGGGSAKSLLL